ncbi:MAG TPA: transglutaminaseTgpA domain-containing protein, partial [Nitrolancea sp.]|nr:transglutaminaseTgpA domain-containing protein [Nitrolancea sp.]
QGQRAEDLYLFVLLMGALVWIMAYTSVWLVFRSRSVWLALLFSGIVVFTNLGYSLKVPTTLLILYLFAAILLLMRFSLAQREERWRRSGVPFPDTLAWRGLWVASYLALGVLIFGWVFPVAPQSQSLVTAWQRIDGPWVQVRDSLNGWFSGLRGPNAGGGPGGFAAFSDQFAVGGPLRLSTTPVVLVKGGNSQYLIAHTYSTFTGRSWTSGDDTLASEPLVRLDANQAYPLPSTSAKDRGNTSFEVQILQPRGTVVYTADELGSVTVPSQLQLSWYYYQNQSLDVTTATEANTPPTLWPLVQLLKDADFAPVERGGGVFGLPPDLQVPRERGITPTASPAPEAAAPGEGTPTPEGSPTPAASATPAASPTPNDFGRLPLVGSLPNVTPPPGRSRVAVPENWNDIHSAMEELTARHIDTQVLLSPTFAVQTLRFTGNLPVYADLEAVFSQSGVRTGDSYTVSSLPSQATVDTLRQASTAYPVEIASRYLQLPTVTPRVSALAHEIGDGQANAYDKASAIQNFLRTNYKYNENVNAPPRDDDIVDYFLFESKQGYCTYYSTSMVEMLRILGIPAREVVGFYPASFDQNAGGFLYRDLNSHAWVEAYFPGYGWIPFEPTAARAEIARYVPPAPSSPSSSTSGSSQLPPNADGRLQELNELGGGGFGGPVVTQHHTSPYEWALRALAVLALLALVVLSYLWLRGLRGLSPSTQLFTKLQRGASWGGIRADPALTPYEYAGTVGKRVPGARTHASLLADLYVKERYGAYPVASDELSRARHAWLRLRSLLLRHLLLDQWRPSVRARVLDEADD